MIEDIYLLISHGRKQEIKVEKTKQDKTNIGVSTTVIKGKI